MSDCADLWSKLEGAKGCKSLLHKHLTKARYEALKDKKTKFGGTLADCIRSGSLNLDSGVGCYACDPDAYYVFSDFFDAVIKDYHKVDKVEHPTPSFEAAKGKESLNMVNPDPEGKYIVSTRIRTGRSHDSYGFPPVINKEDLVSMEKACVEAFNKLPEDLAGTYFPLTGMKEADRKQLVDDHFLFKDDDRMLRDAGGYKNWPTGRGIFHNKDKTFLIWCNEEDHLRIISMQMGGDIAGVFNRLAKGIKSMESSGLSFAKKDTLGNLTFCPTNLGTALRASVHMRIPKVSARPDFNEICEKLNIQPRGIHGEHTESVGGVYDLSNKRRLGLSEYEAVCEMYKGVVELLRLEKEAS